MSRARTGGVAGSAYGIFVGRNDLFKYLGPQKNAFESFIVRNCAQIMCIHTPLLFAFSWHISVGASPCWTLSKVPGRKTLRKMLGPG